MSISTYSEGKVYIELIFSVQIHSTLGYRIHIR